jgi:hypothetical protein
MTGLSIRVMPNFDFLRSKFVLTQSKAADGTVRWTTMAVPWDRRFPSAALISTL